MGILSAKQKHNFIVFSIIIIIQASFSHKTFCSLQSSYLKRKMALRQMLGRNKRWLAAEASPLVAAVGVAFGALVFFGARTAMTASDVNFKKRSVEEQKDYYVPKRPLFTKRYDSLEQSSSKNSSSNNKEFAAGAPNHMLLKLMAINY